MLGKYSRTQINSKEKISSIFPRTYICTEFDSWMINFENTANAFEYRSRIQLKKANFLFKAMASPTITRLGSWITPKFLWLPFVRTLVKKTIYEQFCGGENLTEAAGTALKLSKYGVGTLLDYGVEGKTSEEEFDLARDSFIRAIEFAKKKDYISFISIKLTGLFRFSLLEKIHLNKALSEIENDEKNRGIRRLEAICQAGDLNNTIILIDAEESWVQAPVDELAILMMQRFNSNRKMVVYNTYQMYRHDRLAFLKENVENAQQNGYILGAKVVRGAYMEKERARAKRLGYESPIQATKENTDSDYDLAVAYCIENREAVASFIGTHNEKSCLLQTEKMKKNGIKKNFGQIFFNNIYERIFKKSLNLPK